MSAPNFGIGAFQAPTSGGGGRNGDPLARVLVGTVPRPPRIGRCSLLEKRNGNLVAWQGIGKEARQQQGKKAVAVGGGDGLSQ